MIVEKRFPSNGLLDKIIENLIEERVFGIPRKKTEEPTDYNKVDEGLIILSNSIRAKLGSNQNLFMQYEELSTINENSSLRDIYRKGFIDAVALLREICFNA